MHNVLIIDDDIELAGLFQEYLTLEGFTVDVSHTGTSGLQNALSGEYQLVILDIMLPDIKGTEILAHIRQESRIPVLMFTAKGDDVDRIIGLESGADDYVPKPCTPRELVARIRAILRRTQPVAELSQGPIVAGPLKLWPEKRKAAWLEQDLELTSTEFNLLEALANHVGRVVSKNELSEKALGRPLARFDRSIDVHMSSIRQKLGNQQDGSSYIQTVRGQGYQLIKE
ncbi:MULTISPECIES: response regulator transcription factor [Methylomonas]|uniref:Two-component system response regulator n=2 Tax=Methylomonas TaxID=416 RepID=A0A126T148_9GAMM|nr:MULTISPECIES: response regulator transcription factor [Methylomonas]AMK75807.1 two-component system response regulator [Methylomonas denitrificans]OAH98562.1 DNA-binding response regulator [Methylomonas methanica]TCV80164.1 two-component system OmpR family response regulator/two-component system response regulator CpxR [Methylomonas methanica]